MAKVAISGGGNTVAAAADAAFLIEEDVSGFRADAFLVGDGDAAIVEIVPTLVGAVLGVSGVMAPAHPAEMVGHTDEIVSGTAT